MVHQPSILFWVGTVSHTGYLGCKKRVELGEYFRNHDFPDINSKLKTDKDFL